MGWRCAGVLTALFLATSIVGCRSCCCADVYHCAIDHVHDYPMLFDTWYNPRLDISRAGKPDWCGPINRVLGCRRCDCVVPWKRFDRTWLYPPRYPYLYPGAAYPGPSQREIEPEFRDRYETEQVMPVEELIPTPTILPEPPPAPPAQEAPPSPQPPEE